MMSRLLVCWLYILIPISASLAQERPLSPAEAPRHMTLPAGFQVTLFAGEPDVVQPIAFTIDDRGRLWVAECLSYPDWIKNGKAGHDRILIFEDRNGDGHFDHCKVFCDNLANVSGLAVGFGGVWVCATPNLLFIPDRAGQDRPDGPPQVILDGWDLRAQHNIFNDLVWGPDGWLYGCNGIMSNSLVGKPGTPDSERVALNCGVWRYHPTRHTFEVVANGTTNPWGLDFNDLGQMFITNCVIKHLWHVIPGAHFQRMYGQDLNPNVYELMESPADHIHWAGGPWTDSRGGQGKHGEAGGGHAHVGCMVYLGDNWPDRYRGHVFMCNLHGNRVNQDVLERRGSAYVAHHGHDFLFAHDPWFRGLALRYGPDGGVFVTDWTDTGECHNYKQIDRSNGRIYKVTYGKPRAWHGDIAKLPDAELVRLQLHKNDWFVRHARRVLQERAAAGKLAADTPARLRELLTHQPDVTRQLRALWTLYVTGSLEHADYVRALDSPQEAIRGWAIQLALDERRPWPALVDRLAALANSDPSPWVRLYVASALQRLPAAQRWAIAEGLLKHGEDAMDQNLPLMMWYGVEPLVGADPDRAARLIPQARIPKVREFLARRIADPVRLVALLARTRESAVQADVLRGFQAAFEGHRHVPMPSTWPAAFERLRGSPNAEVRHRALTVAVLFGDRRAMTLLRQTLMDRQAAPPERLNALQALLGSKDLTLPPLLQKLVMDPAVRREAIRALAAYRDPATPRVLLAHFGSFDSETRADAVETLASRPSYALALLDAVAHRQVARHDLSAFTIRQLANLKDRQVSERLKQVWGTVRPASKDKAMLMARYKALLTPEYRKQANLSHGRLLFTRTCASCHRLFGEGGDVGPELTGAQRHTLDYLLENILDPSAVVAKDYQVTILETKEGRVLTGIIKRETAETLTVQTQNEKLVLPKNEIDSRSVSPISMMPEGLLSKLSNEEVRDLLGYLDSPDQVPLPPAPPSASAHSKQSISARGRHPS